MTDFEIKNRYFNWLLSLIHVHDTNYSILLEKLYNTKFRYMRNIPMDENREADGLTMRYNFGYICGYDNDLISNALCDRACTVLEMLIALANREENILSISMDDDRIDIWFSTMLKNLKLERYDNDHYDDEAVSRILDIWMDRRYDECGRGNIFFIPEPIEDLRAVDIWTQLQWYIDYYNIK